MLSPRQPASSPVPIISLQDLSKTYRTDKGDTPALQKLNVNIEEGQFIAVVGPSGCGKSTLLKILAGLHKASSGVASISGSPVSGPRRDVGVVFQSPVLFPWRTVLENVLLPAQVQHLDIQIHRNNALSLLSLVGLNEFSDHYPRELSGGMQQRVAISRALVNDPSLLLMDEPFGALDAMTREHLNVELQRIWLEKKKTILFITHSIPESIFLADRVLVMSPRPGRIIEDMLIPLPRPRGLEVMNTAEFGGYVSQIRRLFNVKGGMDG